MAHEIAERFIAVAVDFVTFNIMLMLLVTLLINRFGRGFVGHVERRRGAPAGADWNGS